MGEEEHRRPCSGCGTVLHSDCWRELERCPTLGCVGAAKIRSVAREQTYPPLQPRDPTLNPPEFFSGRWMEWWAELPLKLRALRMAQVVGMFGLLIGLAGGFMYGGLILPAPTKGHYADEIHWLQGFR
jgi:hypothetical protein